MVFSLYIDGRTVGKLGRRADVILLREGLEEELVGLHQYRRAGSQSDQTWGVMRCDRRPPLGLGSGPMSSFSTLTDPCLAQVRRSCHSGRE